MSNLSQDRINSLLGAPGNLDTGANIINKQVSPLTGDVRVNTITAKERSPSETATLVRVWDPARQQYVERPSGEIMGDLAPSMTPGVTVTAAPALGEEAAATAAVGRAQQLRAEAAQVPETKATMQNMRDQLSKFTPGPRANWTYMIGALAQQLGVAAPSVTEGVAGQEEFNKLATRFINQQIGSLGGSGTDAKLESAAKGSPTEFMSKEGILSVTNLMLGLEDAKAAKNAAWQKWLNSGQSPSTFDKFEAEFNGIYNPRVFQSVYMSEPQKQTMMKNMTPKEREQFQKDWTVASKAGWIQ